MSGSSLRTYFQDKIKQKEPNLFFTNKTPGKGKSEPYSRSCQSSQKRQPVILTKDEYQTIVEKHPEYTNNDKHVVYGTGPNKYYYICPQYWDIRTNLPISEDEMRAGNLYDHVVDDKQKKNNKYQVYL